MQGSPLANATIRPIVMADATTIAGRIERMQERIHAAVRRAGRNDEVRLVTVSKTVEPGRILEAYHCGLRHFGENRVQEFEGKRGALTLPDATWHLIGHLQTNKARRAIELFDRVDSVDSLRLAERLARSAKEQGKVLPVLLQVHLGEEESKHGVAPDAVRSLAEQVAGLEGLRVEGLMAIPPFLDDPEQVRPYFRRLRELAGEIDRQEVPGLSLKTLSMGMTHDFEVAIEEGATEVRLGTAIFGPRPPVEQGGA